MLRSEARRLERRQTLRRRILAGGTAVLLALGMAAGGAAPAFATSPSTSNPNHVDYWKAQYPNAVECYSHTSNGGAHGSVVNGAVVLAPYGANWPGDRWEVLIVKGGSSGGDGNGNAVYELPTAGLAATYVAPINPQNNKPHDVSHWIVCKGATPPPEVPQAGNDLDCVTATNYPGRALTNGDHINMAVIQNGVDLKISAQIDIRQSQDPPSESGLVVRVNAPGGPYTLPITNAQKASGIFSFTYSTYVTGQWTVEWVQFNSTYFNKERKDINFLLCGELDTHDLVVPTVGQTALECDTAGTYTLDDIEGVRWFIGDDEVQPGTYQVTTASTVVVRAEADAPEYGLDPEADSEFTFVFTEPQDCVLPCLPASAVSYTYYNLDTFTLDNPANSGLITVTARDGYSDELCNPFWVVAAAWDFSSSTSIWPQTLKATDPAGDHEEGYIDSVGTYFFYVPVDCGQGDVYASFTAKPYVGPELFGPSNPFTEKFLHDMGFTGPNPTYLVTAPGCNVANPIAPIATPIRECNTYGSINIGAVANPYVGYTVYRGAADDQGSVSGLDSVPASEAKEGVFTVVATAMNGHIFAPGTIRQWEFDLGTFYLCELPELPITNASIGFIDPTCDLGQQLDPSKLLVDDDTLAELHSYEVFDDNTYEVVFVTIDEDARFFDSDTPTPGRTVSEGGTKLTFTGTLDGPLTGDDCDREIEVVDPYGYTDTCLDGPSFWVRLVEGIEYTITVDDETPVIVGWEGVNEVRNFTAAPGATLNITASATAGFTLAPQPGPLDHVFEEWPEECLPTLPLVEASVTFTPASCLDATNWVTLPDVEGVQWWVDGAQTAAGKWAMPAGEVVVDATALDGFGFSQEATTHWEHTFAALDDVCDLSELAETGASNALVGIGFAAVIITLAGMGVVIGRRFQQA